jgi:hypothetical protein
MRGHDVEPHQAEAIDGARYLATSDFRPPRLRHLPMLAIIFTVGALMKTSEDHIPIAEKLLIIAGCVLLYFIWIVILHVVERDSNRRSG